MATVTMESPLNTYPSVYTEIQSIQLTETQKKGPRSFQGSVQK